MNVYEATQKRLELVFREFDNVYVSFSGGKDSGVLLNLCLDYIQKHGANRKLPVFHIDYEAQYQMTTDYVDKVFRDDRIDPYRVCLPLSVPCATSMHQSYWIPWDKDKKELWVRDMPESVNEDNHQFDFFSKGLRDYTLQDKFGVWLHKKKGAGRTACLVGIRTQESLNRWRAIHSAANYRNFNGVEWTKEMGDPNVFNVYPIFDWTTEDIWTANAKMGWEYNRLYDLFHKAGLTIGQMRVASPFNDCAKESLSVYRVVDPRNWGKMIGRVDGVNFTGLYGGTTAMGWRNIKLPDGHTWKSYMEFLLSTLPREAADNYKKKTGQEYFPLARHWECFAR